MRHVQLAQQPTASTSTRAHLAALVPRLAEQQLLVGHARLARGWVQVQELVVGAVRNALHHASHRGLALHALGTLRRLPARRGSLCGLRVAVVV
jgi:hypothetical protein